MRKIFILVMTIYTLQGCLNAETKSTKAMISHQAKVYYYLKEELKAGYSHGDEGQAMEMDRAYFSVVGEELRQHLQKSGFKFLEPETFKMKVKKLFGLNEKYYIKESTRDYIDTLALPFAMDMLTFLPDKKLLTFPYKMPEIIDYPKKYPELVAYEKRINNKKDKNRIPWSKKHKEGYTQYTQNNLAYIVAINKYLLNDDFSQRTWLIENTYKLMYDLYAGGYKEDTGLLKALLKEGIKDNHKHLEWYGISAEKIKYLLVLPRKIDGYYRVREESFMYLTDLITKDQLVEKHSKDGKRALSNPSQYIYALEQFVQKFKKIKSYKPAVSYVKKFLKLHSNEFHTVLQKKISLDKNTAGELILQEESYQELAEKPAKIILNYDINGIKKEYTFIDSSHKFPLLYFSNLIFNTKTSDNMNLLNSINIVPSNDGENIIFIYGTSHYGGSGLVGKLIILKKNKRGDIQKIGMIEANDNFEMQYIKKENIIIVAQFIWQQGVEGHYGDKHRYKLDIYDLNNKLKKIPLYTTEEKYSDQNSSVINDNLDEILKKYNLYKQNSI